MIVTRFPPSPTGYLHVGGARTALYSWLFARQNNGKFVLRIEDTDRERSNQESIQAIMDGMQWLGLDYDEGPFYQTERFDRYKEVIQSLLDSGKAYRCFCTREELDEMREQQKAAGLKPRYDGRWRERTDHPDGQSSVIRFKNPLDGDVIIQDVVKGPIKVSNQELDDLIIERSDGTPTYNLAVVVDDMDMGITHVVRGDDHINNTPRQMNILAALGAEIPKYAHVPMILGDDGARLSKRHGAVSVMQYRDEGYLPEALLNYLVRLGWSHGDQEMFTRDEMLELFALENINRAPSAFNTSKLLWLNQEYIKAMPAQELYEKSQWYFEQAKVSVPNEQRTLDVFDLIKERCKTLLELVQQTRFFFTDIESYDEGAVKKHIKENSVDLLSALLQRVEQVEDWSVDNLQLAIKSVVDENQVGFAKVAQPARIALTGNVVSPSLDQTMAVLGRDRSLARLGAAISHFG
jgi:glutamyl-tRNA synthetase